MTTAMPAERPPLPAAIGTIAGLTFHEARRRRVLAAALVVGAAFVALFAVALHFMARDVRAHAPASQQALFINAFVLVALYAANFLIVVTAVLVTVETLAGEIASGVIETLCTKPLPRAAVVLGKWLGCWLVLAVYGLTLWGGVLAVARLVGGVTPPNATQGAACVLLAGSVLLTLTLAGGARLSSLANGVAMIGLYGLAFIAGWTEQFGTLAGNAAARYLGIGLSLVVPSESLWQLASYYMQPPLARGVQIGPFMTASVPSPAMVAWAVGHVLVVLAVAVRLFRSRDL